MIFNFYRARYLDKFLDAILQIEFIYSDLLKFLDNLTMSITDKITVRWRARKVIKYVPLL